MPGTQTLAVFWFAAIPVAIAIAAALAGAAIWAALRQVKGAKIAVLGPRMSGKTTLIHALRKEKIPDTYTPTTSTTIHEAKPLHLDGLALDVIEISDHAGSRDALGEWKKDAEDADLVIFMVDVARTLEAGYAEGTLRLARNVGSWDLSAEVHLVLTHTDQDPEWASVTIGPPALPGIGYNSDGDSPIFDTLIQRDIVRGIRRALRARDVSAGNLLDDQQRWDILMGVLSHLKRVKDK